MDSILVIVIIVVILAVILKTKSPQSIGKQGENFVNGKLFSKLDQDYYKILEDVLLSTNSDIGTTQIDHIVVSNFGIFCIETKAYSGWIFGRANDKYWTQVIYHKKSRFYNPLRQNYGHIKTIEHLIAPLNISVPVYSYVAFPDAEELKITGTDLVGYAGDIIYKIKAHDQVLITNEQKDRIVNLISQANILDKDIYKLHSQRVSEMRQTPQLQQNQQGDNQENEDDNYDDDDFYDDDDSYDDDF